MREFPLKNIWLRVAWAAAGVVALSALAGGADALPKRSQPTCNCSCDTGPNGVHDMTYAGMAVCGAYDGKTCNVEVSPGVVRSGTLRNCGRGTRWVDMVAGHVAGMQALSSDPTVVQSPTVKASRAPAAGAATRKP